MALVMQIFARSRILSFRIQFKDDTSIPSFEQIEHSTRSELLKRIEPFGLVMKFKANYLAVNILLVNHQSPEIVNARYVNTNILSVHVYTPIYVQKANSKSASPHSFSTTRLEKVLPCTNTTNPSCKPFRGLSLTSFAPRSTMGSQISPPDWPEKPKLDFTNDDNRVTICLNIDAAGTPKSKVYHVSKLRLAYHSPRFRKIFDEQDLHVVDSRNLCFQELAAPPGEDCEVFSHIVPYVNTGSTIIPSQSNKDTLQYPCRRCTLASLERGCRNSLSLSTLAHIWYLAGYLRMPHCQNITLIIFTAFFPISQLIVIAIVAFMTKILS
ncbi:hypothetical protein EAE96_006634 [Botrytis aclada]|nr:hypothetical protein EAE96_006634 [Botrytis aclada]